MPEHKIVGCNSGAPNEAIAFEIASGTVAGRHHISAGRGSQDALCVLTGKDAIVGVVCDGCSSEAHSELGAIMMSKIIARDFLSLTFNSCKDPYTLVQFGSSLLHRAMGTVADFIGGGKQTVYDYLLFSVVGFVISPKASYVFYGGDGLWWANSDDGFHNGFHYEKSSEVRHILPGHGNQPAYPAYLLTTREDHQPFQLKLACSFHACLISSVGVGTDGIADLIAAENENMPGHAEKVGPLSQFWTDDKYYANPDAVRRKLWLCAQEHRRADWQGQQIVKEGAKLIDDTTLISVRRKI